MKPSHCHIRGVLSALAAGILLAACATGPWEDALKTDLLLFGHRNWIVIADSAYPAQSRPGIETYVTGANHLDLVAGVLEALDEMPHVKPVVYLDAELEHVSATDAPGITAHRDVLGRLLAKRTVKTLPHEELIARLDKAGEMYRVLVLKSNATLPYTSVFLELDCAYWTAEAESRVRAAVGKGK
ncbi:MAG: hypothetical protein N3D11_13865 [Candidatus Sumerlaeia bacterium]|nr:hypothetical protein [Candidatus Sumerlaeia bacterium]